MKRNERGSAVYASFTDLYGNKVKVQQSSLATAEAVWIFSDTEGIHLDKPKAQRLIKALKAFVGEDTQRRQRMEAVKKLPRKERGKAFSELWRAKKEASKN